MTHDRFAERRRTVAEDRARRALRSTTVILGMAAMIAGVVYLFHSPVLSVKTLDIEGAEHAGVDHVLASHGISIGEPLIWTDVAGATAALTDDPWVESVSVERRWPTTVNVSVAERQPVGTVGGVAVAVDGVILPNAPVEGLPVVRIEGEAVGRRAWWRWSRGTRCDSGGPWTWRRRPGRSARCSTKSHLKGPRSRSWPPHARRCWPRMRRFRQLPATPRTLKSWMRVEHNPRPGQPWTST